jgi:3-methyladenine DNA glycosylase/8-oxoguanine DNA glycosylase
VTQVAGPDAPRLSAVLTGRQIDQPAEELVRRTLDRLVGLSVDLSQFAAMAAPDPLLGPLAARMRGLKPPRFATVFEALIKTLDLAWELLAAFPADELKRLTPELVQRYGRTAPNS